MSVTTIRSLANELGVTYWQIRHILRCGYVPVERPARKRKVYLAPAEVRAIKAHFGLCDPEQPSVETIREPQASGATPRP